MQLWILTLTGLQPDHPATAMACHRRRRSGESRDFRAVDLLSPDGTQRNLGLFSQHGEQRDLGLIFVMAALVARWPRLTRSRHKVPLLLYPKPSRIMPEPAVWFPAVHCHSGADVFTERLAAALQQRGVRAEVTWLPHRAEYAPWSVPVPKAPKWANMVHINTWLPPRFVPRHLPLLATVHSPVHDPAYRPYKKPLQALYHRLWIRRIEANHLRRADQVVAVSHYTAHIAEQIFGCVNIAVIHNGVDCRRFVPLDRVRPHHPFRLLYVGNWSARKGVDLFVPILRLLGEEFVLHYTADRVGRQQLPLPSNAVNIGRLSGIDLVRAYQEADALLFPTRLEGLPLAALESMACGTPVIAARVSSLPEVIEHGVSGLLCDSHSVDAFIAACRWLRDHPQQWCAMRQQARARVLRFFDEEGMVDGYLARYHALLMNHRLTNGSSKR